MFDERKTMTQRRDFLKKAAMGTLAVSPIGGVARFSGTDQNVKNIIGNNDHDRSCSHQEFQHGKWNTVFNEKESRLVLKNHELLVQGKLRFESGDEVWTVARSRDGVSNRYALLDNKGDVQGYWLFNQTGARLALQFYHRTAQRFEGQLLFEGAISFFSDAFPCRTRPGKGENVLQLASGTADSLLNDSLFSPLHDLVLQFNAANLSIYQKGESSFAFRMSGNIEEAPDATFSFILQENYFKNSYVPYYQTIDRDRCPVAPTGWMSWNTYFDKATAEDNLAEARIGKRYLQPFGCEFWSIESWQRNSDQLPVRDFHNMDLEVNEKQFPKGMKHLADEIRKLGFRPGLWMAPFGTGNDEFYKKHKDWFLHDNKGNPISSWNGKYTLDPTVKEARDHLQEIHRVASHEWGYEFFKIDGMSGRNRGYCAHLYERPEIRAHFSDPACPNPFELCVQSFREGMGDDRVFLACQGHSSGPEAKYADASRIGADIVHPNQPVKWSGVLNQASCLLNQAFTHNIVMYADPDTLLVRDLPLEEARTSATIVALPGQLTFFGDKLAGLPKEKMKILQQTLPVADVRPVSLYPYFRMLPVWNLSVHHKKLGSYNVVAFFNWENQASVLSVTPQELGIPDIDYTGFEFWEKQAFNYKTSDKKLSLEVPPHAVRLIAIHPLQEVPQWISSDRHIAQTGMEMVDAAWDKSRSRLKGTIRLVGSFPLTMYVRLPQQYIYEKIECMDAEYMVVQDRDLLSITFQRAKSAETDFTVCFIEKTDVS